MTRIWCGSRAPGANTIKKNTNSTPNKSQTHRAKQYEVTSLLSTDCELSTDTCSKNVYSLGPRPGNENGIQHKTHAEHCWPANAMRTTVSMLSHYREAKQ